MAWLSGYSYRKQITLNGSTAGAQSDYQLKLLLGESSGASGEDVDCGAKCQADFDDIRFTKADGTTLLDYWIESITGSTPNQLATIWIEFDSIPASPDTATFYMYYGNAGASAVTSGAATFLFFDDFGGDLSKWSVISGTWAADSGTLKHTGQTGDKYIRSDPYQVADARIRSRLKTSCASSTQTNMLMVGARGYAPAQFHYAAGPWGAQSAERNRIEEDGSQRAYTDYSWDADTYMVTEFRLYGAALSAYVNDAYEISCSDDTYLDSDYIGFKGNLPTGQYGYVDWVFVAKYAEAEPTWGSWGGEEELTPKTSSDSGSGAEVSSLAATLVQSETGVGTDAQTALLAAIIHADSGVGVEALGDRAITLVEAAVGAEITSLARTLFDSAVGSENSYLKILEGVKTSSDSGSGVDASAAMVVSHLRSDTGAATETVVSRALFAREYPGGALDLAKALVATLRTTDEGTGSEAARQAVAIEASETGSGSDASALVGSLLAHDTAVATEAVTVLAAMVSQDSGVGIEKVLAFFRQVFDAGEGQEIVQLVGLVGRLMKALQYTSAYRQTTIYTAAYRKVRIWTGTREEEHMEVTNVFPRGDVVPIYYNVEDWQGNYIDPSGGCVCSLWQPDGTMATDLADEEIDEEPMTKLDTGRYVYYYYSRDTDPKKFFRSVCTAIDGTGDTTKRTSKSWSFRLQ